MKQKIALLGSTGSIGVQTLDIVRDNPDRFEITVLTSNNNWEILVKQALEFEPDSVVIADKTHYNNVKTALEHAPIKVYAGADALEQIVRGDGVDVVVNALVGYAGLPPTVSALKAGKKLALANKESLVVAGETVMKLAIENKVPILPIDSEHSAIFQCLSGEVNSIDKLILTASGGPFLHTPLADLKNVSIAQALNHPNWSMGSKITIDSATMMNKGFEVIEAHWLFGTAPSKIEVLIHPQSVVHSMVEFTDGAIKAQLGTADMHLPIQYALTYPERLPINQERFDFSKYSQLTFLVADEEKFPNLRIAYNSLQRGGNTCCVLNAANEIAVAAFLCGKIGFTDITKTIEKTLEKASFIKNPSIEDYHNSNLEARAIAMEMSDGAIKSRHKTTLK